MKVKLAGIEDSIGSAFSGVVTAFAGIGTYIPYIIVFCGLVGVGVWWYFDSKYNKNATLFKPVGEGFRLVQDRAKLIKDKNGVPFWRLKKVRVNVDVPPDSCMVASAKGETAFGYVTSAGEIVWSSPEYHPDKLIKKIKDLTTEQLKDGVESNLDNFEKEHYEFMKTFRPVSTTQRASLAYQIEKAMREVKTDWKQHMPLIVSGVILVLVLAIFMMFFGKVVAPITAASDSINAGKEIDLKSLEILERIEARIQVAEPSDILVPRDGGVTPR